MPNHDIIPGAEPFFIEGNDVGVLVLHGFTSTPQVVRAYGEQLANEGGFTVSAPLLAGHGTRQEDLLGITALDWIRNVVEAADALQKQCSRMFITGQSLGGLLTLYMTAAYPDRFAGAIPINAPALLPDADRSAAIFDLDGPAELDNGEPDIKKPDVFEIVYESMPMAAYRELFALLSATHAMLPRITCPMLLMHALEDHWVSADNATYIHDTISASDRAILWLENSYHVATLDYDQERIGQEAIGFIERVAQARA